MSRVQAYIAVYGIVEKKMETTIVDDIRFRVWGLIMVSGFGVLGFRVEDLGF